MTVRRSITLEFSPCEVCGKKNGRPGHQCDGDEALRKAARELFGPTLDLVEPMLVKAGTGILRGIFEVAFERDDLRASIVAILNELNGVGPDSSLEFHRMALDSIRHIASTALGKK